MALWIPLPLEVKKEFRGMEICPYLLRIYDKLQRNIFVAKSAKALLFNWPFKTPANVFKAREIVWVIPLVFRLVKTTRSDNVTVPREN